jgi:hypothetical protein
MTQVYLATQFRILRRVYKQPHPNPSTEAWNLAFILAIYKATPLPATPTPLYILNLVIHTNASFLT